MGKVAAGALLEAMENARSGIRRPPTQVLLPPELVLRGSTAPPTAGGV
jgi:DNA-binding LacI/PurR family transcriptional regulator